MKLDPSMREVMSGVRRLLPAKGTAGVKSSKSQVPSRTAVL